MDDFDIINVNEEIKIEKVFSNSDKVKYNLFLDYSKHSSTHKSELF